VLPPLKDPLQLFKQFCERSWWRLGSTTTSLRLRSWEYLLWKMYRVTSNLKTLEHLCTPPSNRHHQSDIWSVMPSLLCWVNVIAVQNHYIHMSQPAWAGSKSVAMRKFWNFRCEKNPFTSFPYLLSAGDCWVLISERWRRRLSEVSFGVYRSRSVTLILVSFL